MAVFSKAKTLMKNTDNRTIYKRVRWYVLSIEEGYCAWCKPHRGCNSKRDRMIRNWKRYRKTQYKEINYESDLLKLFNCDIICTDQINIGGSS
jgi:hypothetical protein